MGEISEKAIRERAYHIWEREGCPHGRDFEHWVQAQVELAALGKGNGGGSAAARRTPTAGNAASKPAVTPARSKRGKKPA
jgi:hypothetical protein